jgi:hypothetical protein
MSQDPNDYYEPRDYAGGEFSEPSVPPLADLRRREAVERVRLPATFLLVSGGLNLLGCLYWLFNAFVVTIMPAAQMQQYHKQMGLPAPQGTPEEHAMQLVVAWGFLVAGILATVLPILAGMRMLVLRNYALCIVGSIVTAIPCMSCPSGCMVLGQVAGIWALVVLMNDEVRSFFR